MEKELEVEITTVSERTVDGLNDAILISGGDDTNPTWHEYLKNFKKKYRSHILLIRDKIRESGYIGMTSEEMMKKKISFEFSDNVIIFFTVEAWGDLMQAIVNKKEGFKKYM